MRKKIFIELAKRFFWDISDPNERKYYGYWLISQIPCNFGNILRGWYLSKKFKSVGRNLRVYAGARFRSIENIVAGDNLEIGYDNFIQAYGGVTIGDNVMLAPGVKIWSVNHEYRSSKVLIRNQTIIKGPVKIGNDVWICSNSFICPGVSIPDGVVVSAGSVVNVKSYPAFSILAGNPARAIGFRDSSYPT